MTPDERQMLADLFERIRSTATSARDSQAEAFINDSVRSQPYSPYVLAQTVLVQQQALEGAAKRIAELESHAQAPAQETSFLGSLGRSLFGGPQSSQPTPSQARPGSYDASSYQRSAGPSYAPQQPQQGYPQQGQGYPQQAAGPWGAPGAPAGGGFMSGALRTATGVAGGLLVGNALENMLGGRGGMFGGGGGGGLFGGGAGAAPQETINNFYGSDQAGQHAQDVLQDQDQDQDDAQDASDNGGYDSGGGSDDSI